MGEIFHTVLLLVEIEGHFTHELVRLRTDIVLTAQAVHNIDDDNSVKKCICNVISNVL
jgi:hypothetical protein